MKKGGTYLGLHLDIGNVNNLVALVVTQLPPMLSRRNIARVRDDLILRRLLVQRPKRLGHGLTPGQIHHVEIGVVSPPLADPGARVDVRPVPGGLGQAVPADVANVRVAAEEQVPEEQVGEVLQTGGAPRAAPLDVQDELELGGLVVEGDLGGDARCVEDVWVLDLIGTGPGSVVEADGLWLSHGLA